MAPGSGLLLEERGGMDLRRRRLGLLDLAVARSGCSWFQACIGLQSDLASRPPGHVEPCLWSRGVLSFMQAPSTLITPLPTLTSQPEIRTGPGPSPGAAGSPGQGSSLAPRAGVLATPPAHLAPDFGGGQGH